MKRKLFPAAAAALLLAVLSLAIFLGAQAHLSARGEDVTVTETPLFGDQKEAEGVVMNTAYDYGSLHWDLSCQAENPDRSKTDFQYKFTDETRASYVVAEIDAQSGGLEVPAGSIELATISMSNESEAPFLRKIFLAIAEDTEPGEIAEKTMSMKEWMDYLPVVISHWTAEPYMSPIKLGVFSLPVPDYPSVLSVGKNGDGQVNRYSLDLPDEYLYVRSFEETDDNFCYLIFTDVMANGAKTIMEIPADQRGIYRLPLSDFDALRAAEFLNSDDRFLLCPLPKDAEVLDMEQNETFLLLYTIEDGGIWLSLIRKDTGSITDKFLLREASELSGGVVPMTFQGDNFCLSVLDGGDFCLLTRDGDTYTPAFSGSLNHCGLMKEIGLSTIQADFDGSRLAVLATVNSDSDDADTRPHGYSFLQVFDGAGLAYMGKYESSLQTLPLDQDFDLRAAAVSVSFTDPKEASK